MKVALIDADTIAYRSSASAEKRSVEVIHKPSGRTKVFKNKTEFKEVLKAKDRLDKLDEYEIIPKQEAEPFEKIIPVMKSMINKILDKTEADLHTLCLSSKTNFRNDLPLPTLYKGNRKATLKPIHLDACKKYLYKEYPTAVSDNLEADDLLSILGYQYLSEGYEAIICSNDKDTLQATGLFMYDYTKEDPEVFSIPDIGYLVKEPNKVSGCGFMYLAYQTLAGDSTDGYKPSYLSKEKLGDIGVYNILKDLKDHREISQAVLETYQWLFPEPFDYRDHKGQLHKDKTYKDMLNLYFNCSYMKRSFNDDTTGVNLYDSYIY